MHVHRLVWYHCIIGQLHFSLIFAVFSVNRTLLFDESRFSFHFWRSPLSIELLHCKEEQCSVKISYKYILFGLNTESDRDKILPIFLKFFTLECDSRKKHVRELIQVGKHLSSCSQVCFKPNKFWNIQINTSHLILNLIEARYWILVYYQTLVRNAPMLSHVSEYNWIERCLCQIR